LTYFPIVCPLNCCFSLVSCSAEVKTAVDQAELNRAQQQEDQKATKQAVEISLEHARTADKVLAFSAVLTFGGLTLGSIVVVLSHGAGEEFAATPWNLSLDSSKGFLHSGSWAL
jgi:hypothetical protein